MAVYVTAEGANDLHKRILAWCEAADVEPSELLDWLRVLPMPIQLGDKVDVTQAVEVVRDLKAAMLVLDTRARCTLGLEENSATEQGLAIAAADRIRNAADCTVLAVHHTPRTGNAGRGSNAWDGAVWSDLRIEGSKLAAKVHCEKHKDVQSGCDHDFTLTRHVVGLDLLPGLDAEGADDVGAKSHDAAGQSAKLTTARHLVGQIVWELAPPEGLTATDLLEMTGVSKTRLYDATVWGIAQGFIHNVGTARTVTLDARQEPTTLVAGKWLIPATSR